MTDNFDIPYIDRNDTKMRYKCIISFKISNIPIVCRLQNGYFDPIHTFIFAHFFSLCHLKTYIYSQIRTSWHLNFSRGDANRNPLDFSSIWRWLLIIYIANYFLTRGYSMIKIKMEILYSVFNNIKRLKLLYSTGVDMYQLN